MSCGVLHQHATWYPFTIPLADNPSLFSCLPESLVVSGHGAFLVTPRFPINSHSPSSPVISRRGSHTRFGLQRAKMQLTLSIFLGLLLSAYVHSLAPTDEIQDADPAQSGYLDNHNLHPATVGSSTFGILWKKLYGDDNELHYARPLVVSHEAKFE